MSDLSQLQSITNRILDTKQNAYTELFRACDDLHNLLLQLTDIGDSAEKHKKYISLDSGYALNLTWAAMCIKDITRTKKFMDSIHAAIVDTLEVNPTKTIHILYAGTGPFATLVLPLTARFTSQQVKFSLLEVNEESYHVLQNLVSRLGLEKYMIRIENADATKWKLPVDEHIDIFICETILNGLQSEPQVAICLNIISQCTTEIIMIPQEIRLTAALINEPEKMQEQFIADSTSQSIYILSDIFTLNKESLTKYGPSYYQSMDGVYKFPEIEVVIPPETVAKHPVLYVLTDIKIYKEERLLMDESPLTTPLKLVDLRPHPPSEIRMHYCTGNNPGIQHFSN